MPTRYIQNQNGAVSFLTVVFLAIVLSIMTLSFVRLSVTEQRQAIDDDLTTRAYYAAESGVEDAKRAIVQSLSDSTYNLNGADCIPAENLTPDLDTTNLDTEYTCQLIEMTPGNFRDDLDAWESITIPLDAAGLDRVRVDWHEPSVNDPTGALSPRSSGATDLPRASAWNHPAMLRATVFAIPGTGNFNKDTLQDSVRAGFLNPRDGVLVPSINTASDLDQSVEHAACDASATGSAPICSAILTNLPSYAGAGAQLRYLHLQALYQPTSVTVTMLNNSGATLNFVGAQAIIDVTGRAGDVYRRVQARVALQQQGFELPDVAIWSNEEICKNFTVTDNAGDFRAGNCIWAGGTP